VQLVEPVDQPRTTQPSEGGVYADIGHPDFPDRAALRLIETVTSGGNQ
jgi:hypothetical protein